MQPIPNASRGTVYLTLQNIAQYLVLLVFYFSIAKLFSETLVGQLTVILFIYLITSTLTLLGVPIAVAKFVSEGLGREDVSFSAGTLHSAKKILYFTTIPTMAVLIAISPLFSMWLFNDNLHTIAIAFAFLSVILTNAISYYNSKFLGLGAYVSSAVVFVLWTALQRILALVVTYPLSRGGAQNNYPLQLDFLIGGWVAGAAVALFASILMNRHKLHSKPSKQINVRRIFMFSYPVWGYLVVVALQSWVDIVLLYALGTDFKTVGIYYLIANGATFLSVVWVGLSSAVLPSMSASLARRDTSLFGMFFEKATRLLNVVVIPIGFIVAAVSPSLLILVYGPSYAANGAPAFALLAILSIIPGYVALFVSTFQAMGKTLSLLKIGIASVLVDVVALVLLVPQHIGDPPGVILAAATARTLTYSVAFGLALFSLRSLVKNHIDISFFRSVFVGVLIALPAGLVVWDSSVLAGFGAYSRLGIAGLLVIGLGIGLSRLFRLFEETDFEMLKAALPNFFSSVVSFLRKLLVVNNKRALAIQSTVSEPPTESDASNKPPT